MTRAVNKSKIESVSDGHNVALPTLFDPGVRRGDIVVSPTRGLISGVLGTAGRTKTDGQSTSKNTSEVGPTNYAGVQLLAEPQRRPLPVW